MVHAGMISRAFGDGFSSHARNDTEQGLASKLYKLYIYAKNLIYMFEPGDILVLETRDISFTQRRYMSYKQLIYTDLTQSIRPREDTAIASDCSRDGSPFVALDRSIAVAAGQILCASRISLQTSQTLTMSLSCRHEV